MQLRYDEDLIEAAVFLAANGAGPPVPPLQVSRFHREREKAYGILDPDERNAAFFKVHLEWFREWGLEKSLTTRLQEFFLLVGALEVLALRKAPRKSDEGAELYVLDETGQRTGILALCPDRFLRLGALNEFLRHELSHLHDMIDPAFGYRPALDLPALNAAQQRLARERYRLLWDITIDGRLAASGRGPITVRDRYAAAFGSAFSFWPAEKVIAVFESLWNDPAPSHAKLVALITDPRGLRASHRPGPGASCPLCGFPTFQWTDADQLTPLITSLVISEFPAWTPEQGLCARCSKVYQAAAGNRSQTMLNLFS